jgi:heme-degrading monooxygenase HmoA
MGDAVTRLVMVRHFLKPGAAGEFDAVFALHRQFASKQAGFLALRRFDPASGGSDDETLVLAEFQTDQDLRAWRGTENHAVIAAKYRALWTREPVTEFFDATE